MTSFSSSVYGTTVKKWEMIKHMIIDETNNNIRRTFVNTAPENLLSWAKWYFTWLMKIQCAISQLANCSRVYWARRESGLLRRFLPQYISFDQPKWLLPGPGCTFCALTVLTVQRNKRPWSTWLQAKVSWTADDGVLSLRSQWTPEEPISPGRPTCSPTGITLDGSSSTRRGCPRRDCHRWVWTTIAWFGQAPLELSNERRTGIGVHFFFLSLHIEVSSVYR